MSEHLSTPNTAEKNRQLQDPAEQLQFNDGSIVLGYRTPGTLIEWEKHKYTRGLDAVGSPNAVIVSTVGRRRFALGNGIAVMLPELDKKTGKFASVNGQINAASLEQIAPNGLPELEIGKPWAIIGGEDPISDVVVDYLSGTTDQNYTQLDAPSPFHQVREILQEVSGKMQDAGHIQ